MIFYFYLKNFFNCFFYLLNSWITKFFHFSSFSIYKVVMLVIKVTFLIASLMLAKLMFSY